MTLQEHVPGWEAAIFRTNRYATYYRDQWELKVDITHDLKMIRMSNHRDWSLSYYEEYETQEALLAELRQIMDDPHAFFLARRL